MLIMEMIIPKMSFLGVIVLNKRSKNNILIKACVLTVILLLTSCANLTLANSSISNAEDAARFVIEQLPIDADEVLIYVWGPVVQGEEILGTEEHILNAPEKGYVIYIDLYPRANLFHPVQYVFLIESTQELIVKDAMSPPSNFADYQMIETAIGALFNSVGNRRAPIPEGTLPIILQRSTDPRYAVLMNGGYNQGNNHVRYWNDLSNIYIALNHVYGFTDENIIVLCSDGLDPAPDQSNGLNSDPDLDGDGDDDIMYSCVLSNVDMVFADLANNLTEANELFIFTTDHGSSNGGWNVVQNLWNYEELTDAYFAELLDALPDCEIICTFEPCFSGGFLDDVVVPPGPVVASSACRHDEYSYAMSNLEYDEYVFHWTAAVKGEDAYGNPVDADYNQDGIISMDEAFLYAEAHDVQPEHPQYGDYPENIGSNISLNISNLPPEDPLKPNGPDEGLTKIEYTFSTSTTDPEEDQIYYLFDWGDGESSGWLGPYNSGDAIQSTHAWIDAGDYEIQVKAKDANDLESDWSDPHSIHILKTPYMKVEQIYGGFFKISAVIRNLGEIEATNIQWSITLDGGIILGRETTGTIPNIPPGGNVTVNSNLILGFGEITVTAKAEIPENTHEKTNNGFAYFLYIKVNPSGSI